MKCPKCDYLGFETGDRCRNCGYDFSLSVTEFEPADYEVHPASIDDLPIRLLNDDGDRILGDTMNLRITPAEPEERFQPASEELALSSSIVRLVPSAPVPSSEPALPLFTPRTAEDDEPLIKLPAAPRPPLAVRRTPDTPRLRAVPRRSSHPSPAPVLQFSEELEPQTPREVAELTASHERTPPRLTATQPSGIASRFVALFIDYGILLGIDAAVVYFTLRMAGLASDDWWLLPVVPMLAFLGLLKVAYFYAFTAVGGQTIGKMAVGTCVVMDNGRPVDAAGAMRRTFAGAVSFLLFGLGFVPALFGDRRALHDRLAGTRVVRLRPV